MNSKHAADITLAFVQSQDVDEGDAGTDVANRCTYRTEQTYGWGRDFIRFSKERHPPLRSTFKLDQP